MAIPIVSEARKVRRYIILQLLHLRIMEDAQKVLSGENQRIPKVQGGRETFVRYWVEVLKGISIEVYCNLQ